MEKEMIKERMLQALQDRQRKLEDDKFTMSLHDGGSKRNDGAVWNKVLIWLLVFFFFFFFFL
jgi:hypothetical protein